MVESVSENASQSMGNLTFKGGIPNVCTAMSFCCIHYKFSRIAFELTDLCLMKMLWKKLNIKPF